MQYEWLETALERRVQDLGYEFVELERAGSRARPVLRVRIDRPDGPPGQGVTVDDCTRVSRALEPLLDEDERIPERYVLEVSSPGVERPLIRPRDFERFKGKDIAMKVTRDLEGRGRRVEGELLGLTGSGDDENIRIRLTEGEIIEVPRRDVARAHLVFRWGG